MCSNSLQRLAHFTSALRLFRLPAAIAGIAWIAASTPLSAEPFAVQQWQAADPQPEAGITPSFSPYYGTGLDQPFDEESWRARHAIADPADRHEVPTGFIASIGRLGLQVDSSDSNSGPRVRGLSWSASEAVSIVAGGNLGDSGGVGASLSVRIGF